MKALVHLPGKILLAGEYSVLEGDAALAFATSHTMRVEVRKSDAATLVHSNLWETPRPLPASGHPSQWDILSEAAWYAEKLVGQGVEIRVDGELNPAYGLGSSSALRLGILWAANKIQSPHLGHDSVADIAARTAYELQVSHQGKASGYDIITQRQGGLVLSRPCGPKPWPGLVERFVPRTSLASFCRVYVGGRGAPTKATIETTSSYLDRANRRSTLRAANRTMIQHLMALFHGQGSLKALLRTLDIWHQVFAEIPNQPQVFERLKAHASFGQDFSIKTTGAGGEDAILVFAEPDLISETDRILCEEGWHHLPCEIDTEGLQGGLVV